MAEEKKDAVKSDATNSTDDTLKNIMDSAMAKLDACMKRMDEWDDEKKKADAVKADESEEKEEKKEDAAFEGKEDPEEEKAERLAADKKKKDSVKKDAEEEKEKMDTARADDVSDLRAMIEKLAKQNDILTQLVRQPIPDSDRSGLATVQARADSVLTSLGEGQAPQPLVGESVSNYRRRMAAKIQVHSKDWEKERLDALSATAFDIAENQIYRDAALAAKTPTNIKPGMMREVRRTSEAGHIVTEFYGAPDTHFTQQFTRRPRKVRNIAYSRP